MTLLVKALIVIALGLVILWLLGLGVHVHFG